MGALLLALFPWWETHTARRGRQPLLDPRLRSTPGYVAGSVIGLVYFIGFTGIWLVLALFLQDGLGYCRHYARAVGHPICNRCGHLRLSLGDWCPGSDAGWWNGADITSARSTASSQEENRLPHDMIHIRRPRNR